MVVLQQTGQTHYQQRDLRICCPTLSCSGLPWVRNSLALIFHVDVGNSWCLFCTHVLCHFYFASPLTTPCYAAVHHCIRRHLILLCSLDPGHKPTGSNLDYRSTTMYNQPKPGGVEQKKKRSNHGIFRKRPESLMS